MSTAKQLLDYILQSHDLPLLTAFVLGALVAINPCQLAISTSAYTYIYKSERRWIDGLSYAVGRAITYTLMGWVLMCLIGGGKNIDGWRALLSKAEAVVPYALIAAGLFMFYRALTFHHHDGDNCHNCRQLIRRNGPMGALILGMTLALAFCPESAIFYFGMMMPLSMKCDVDVGALVPLVFSLGASVPVLALSWLMRKAMSKASQVCAIFNQVQRLLNVFVGIIFIAIAIMLLIGE